MWALHGRGWRIRHPGGPANGAQGMNVRTVIYINSMMFELTRECCAFTHMSMTLS